MSKLLEGRTALITGCNRGIGRSMLEVFARNGAHVWACARKPDENFSRHIETLSKEAGVTISPLYFDLADVAQVKEAGKTIAAAKPPIDILVNNAAAIHVALFAMTPIEKMREMFETNFFSQMQLTQYVVKGMMRQKRGSIVNISSSAAIEGNEGRSAYASSKAALIASTKVLSKELAAFNIRVNAIAPGLTETDMMTGSTPEDALGATLQRTCLRRVGRPEEIANAALFLASDLSSYMTGQTMRVDGGM